LSRILVVSLGLSLMDEASGLQLQQIGKPSKSYQTTTRQSFLSKSMTIAVLASVCTCYVSTPAAFAQENPVLPPKQEFATSAGRKNCLTQSDPARTIVTCQGNLLPITQTDSNNNDHDTSNLRLSGVAATENGVSSSAVKIPSRYAPPWSYLTETSDPDEAWKSLQTALLQQKGLEILLATPTYIHAIAPSILAVPGLESSLDDIEFLLRPNDNVVLVRSVSRTSVFLYPLTQPVSDQNSNRLRLERIRTSLGWDVLQ
jgi:uncharacterized protein (DUF1499 family)